LELEEDEAVSATETGDDPTELIGLTPPRNVAARVETTGFNLSGTLMTKVMSPSAFSS
jgi:hypothetical protein